MVAIVSGSRLGLDLTSLATLGQDGQQGVAFQGRNGEQAWVNVATGNLVLQSRDGYLASRGQDVEALRTYNSQGRLMGGTQDSWAVGSVRQHLALVGVANTSDSAVIRTSRDGAEAYYTWDEAARLYLSTEGAGAYDTIAWNTASSQWTWTDGSSGLVECHDGAGRLLSSVDTSGNTLAYSYDSDGRLATVTSASGEIVMYDYSGGNLIQVRTCLSDGSTVTQVRYSYDANGRLVQVRVDLTPDDNSVSDGNVYCTTYAYDGDSARIAQVTQTDGTSLSLTYVQVGLDYKVASVTNALNQTTRYAYDTANRRTTVVDPVGFATTYDHDMAGQLIQISSVVDGVPLIRNFMYSARGDVVGVSDGEGHASAMEYDDRGNLVLQRDGAGNTVTRTYTAQNQLATQTVYRVPDPDGEGVATPGEPLTTHYVYDGASPHLLRFELSPQGRVTEYRYDSHGQRTASLRYAGATFTLATLTEAGLAAWAASQGTAGLSRTDMAYDFRGQLQTTTTWATLDAAGQGVADGNQSVTHCIYDAAGLLLQTVDGTGGSMSYTYDGLGCLRTSTDALGNLSITSHDDAHNSTTLTLSNGLATTRNHDRAGRLTSTWVSGASPQASQYFHDAAGRLVMTQDATGVCAWILHDEAGRKVADVDGDGSLTEYIYNRSNQLTQTIAYATPVDLSQLIDGMGQPIKPALAMVRPVASAQDQKHWLAYDAAGRLVKTVDPLGAVTQTLYDGTSRIVSVHRYASVVDTASLGSAPDAASIAPMADAANDRISRNFHDSDGLLCATLDGEGYLVELRHDGAGRQIQRIAYATATVPALRAAGTLAQLRPAAGGDDATTRTLWNAKGQVAGELDAEGYLTEHVYDADGNRTQSVRHANKVMVVVTDASTVASLRPTGSAADQVSRWAYDERNRIVQETNAEGTVAQRSYDSAGNLIRMSMAAGTSEVRTLNSRFDLQGRLTGELSAEGGALLTGNPTQAQIDAIWAQHGITHAYDAAGRRISTTDPNGHKTLFFYDRDGRLTHSVNALGEVTESQYDTLGRLSANVRLGTRINPLVFSGGLVSTAFRNVLDTIRNSALDSKVTYTHHTDGTLASSTDALGFATTYAYNVFGEQTSGTVQRGASQASSQTLNLAVTQTLARDRRGLQVAAVSDAGGLHALTRTVYDAFGRVTRTIDANGNVHEQIYDRLGRVVSTVDPLNAVRTTSYDAFDRMLIQTDALGQVTRYSRDGAARSVTVTTPDNITVTTLHTRLGQAQSVTDGRGYTTTYTYDKNGNLRTTGTALSSTGNDYDSAGLLTRTIDANGNLITLTYDAANRLLTRTMDPGGLNLVTRYGYDAKGQQISVTDANGVATELAYDLQGQLIRKTVDPGGLNLVTLYSYDGDGKTLSVTEPGGTLTRYHYDTLGRRASEHVDPTGLNLTRSYSYDANGNLKAATDANGHTTRYAYDTDDRLVTTTDALGNARQTAYDAEGRVIRSAAGDAVEHRVYGANGHLSATVNALGEVVQYRYDANGNVLERVAFARRIDMADWAAGAANLQAALGTAVAAIAQSGKDAVTRQQYDSANRLSYSADGAGAVTHRMYDANGNVTQLIAYASPVAAGAALDSVVASAGDRVTAFTYDAAGRQTFVVDALGGVTQSVHDRNGNATQQTAYARSVAAPTAASTLSHAAVLAQLQPDSANDRSQRTAYDAANRAVFVVDATGAVAETQYDAAGHVVRSISYAVRINTQGLAAHAGVADVRAAVLADAGNDRITRRVYDAGNRLVYMVDGLGYVKKTGYDALGQVTRVTEYAAQFAGLQASSADIAAAVDAAGSASSQDRISTFTYDAAGRLVESTDALGAVERYSYDALGRKIRFINKKGDLWSYQYDASGRLREEISPPVDLVAVRQDASGNLEVDGAHTTTASIVTRLSYDALGNLLARTEAAGRPEERATFYEYDALGRQVRTVFTQAGVYDSATDDLVNNGAGGTATRSDSLHNLITLTQYDTLGNAVASRDLAGHYSYKSYDRLGRVAWDIDAMGQATGYARNTFGEVTRLTRHAVPAEDLNNISARLTGTLIATPGQLPVLTDTTPAGGQPGIAGTRFQPPVLQWAATPADTITTMRYKRQGSSVWSDTVITRQGSIEGVAIPADLPAGAYDIEIEQRDAARLGEQRVSAAVVRDEVADRTLATTYDRAGRVVEVIGPQVYTYDSATRQAYADAAKTTRNTYNAFGDLVRVDELANPQARTWASTTYFHDRRGQLSASVDALGYATFQAYDATGNLVLRTEYANALESWDATHADLATLPGAPAASEDNRTTLTRYDKLGRKTGETRVNLLVSDDGATSTRRGLSTTYGYDAVGNLVRTTDALNNSTYSYYDRLGRVVAVAGPARQDITTDATLTPLTEFKRDAHGNVVLTIRRGTGASSAAEGAYVPVDATADAMDDRLDYAAYDRLGRQTQTTDALRASRYTSYNERGDVAKTWQGVTDEGDATVRTLYQAYRYDALGRLTHTLDPAPDALGQHGAAWVDTHVQYNAFGDITQRASSAWPGSAEYFDYDRAGRVWRTNSGDGVDRVMLYDVQGRATAEIRSTGVQDLRALAGSMAANMLSGGVRRTETVYDALGRTVAQRLPEHIETQGGVSVVHMTAGFTSLVSAQVVQTTSVPGWIGTNQVDLSWSSLASLGSGDVKVEFEYLTKAYDKHAGSYIIHGDVDTVGELPAIHSSGVTRSITRVYTGADADAGGRLQWADPLSGPDGGIEKIKRLVVYKKDRDGLWQKVMDQPALGDAGNHVLVAAPRDPATQVVLEYRLSGGNGPWLTGPAINFGDQLRFAVDGLAHGIYDYQVKTTPVGGSPQITAMGTINLAAPPLAVITTPLAHGFWGEGVLAWQKPADEVVQALRFRPVGGNGTWSSLPVGAPDATHSGVNVFMLPSGNYEYELLYSQAGQLHPFAHATGQFNVTAAQGVQPITGASFLPTVAGSMRLQWPAADTAGATTRVRYKLSTSGTWFDATPSVATEGGLHYLVIGAGLAAGVYDVELMRRDAGGIPVGLATAQLTLLPAVHPPVAMADTTPAHVPAHTLPAVGRPRIEGTTFTAGASGSWALTWPTPAAGAATYLRYRGAGSGTAWIDASPLIQTSGTLQGVNIGPGSMPAGQYEVEVYFAVGGVATAQRTGTLTVSANPAAPAQLADTTPAYQPPVQVATVNYPVIGAQFTAQSHGGWALAWPVPPAGAHATLRYRLADGLDRPYIDASDRIASLDAQRQQITMAPGSLGAGTWDIELFYTAAGQRTAQALGRLTVPAPVPQTPLLTLNPPAYTPAHFSVSTTTVAGAPALSEAAAPASAASSISQQEGTTGAGAMLMRQPTVYRQLDRWGNTVQVSDPRNAGWTTRYQYDANNQVVLQSQSDEQGRHDTVGVAGTAITRLYYDALGRQVGVLDANGHLNRQRFDAGGQRVQEIHADGGMVLNHYDVFGDKVQATDARGYSIRYTYDKLSRLTVATHVPVNVSHIVIAGNDWSLAGTTAALAQRYTYDEAGRQTSQTNRANETTRYRLDLRGNITQTVAPGTSINGHGPATLNVWDAAGRKIAEQDANGNTATWTYDYFGRLIGHVDIGGASHAYTYDHAGQLTRHTNTRGQELSFEYDTAGNNIQTTDHKTGTITRITYDQAGRHVREKTSFAYQRSDGAWAETVYQDNQLAYDQLGRLVWVTDARAFVGISYDSVGNRTRIHTRALEPATGDAQVHGMAGGDLDRYYAYDAMNRQTEAEGHHITYDLAGNKISDTWQGRKVVAEQVPAQYMTLYDANGDPYTVQTQAAQTRYVAVDGQNTTEHYDYDALGQLTRIERDGMLVDRRFYDAAERIVQSGATPHGVPAAYLAALAGMNGQGQPLPGNGIETRLYVYDDQGRVLAQRTVDGQNDRLRYTLDYGNAFDTVDGLQQQVHGYDGAGNLLGYTLADHLAGVGSDYRTAYARYEGYQETRTTVTGSRGTAGSSVSEYDVNGNLARVRDTTQVANDRSFFNDAQGRVLQVTQGSHVQRQLIANGEVMGRFGEAVDDSAARAPNGEPGFTSMANFSFGFTATAGNTPSALPRSHVVGAGDTLQSIAQRMYGDSRMWYRIADANAVTGNDNLRPGQVLAIPPVDLNANAAATFKPYDPARIVGDTSPNLPAPPARASGGGLFGEVLSLVVAAIVTYLTAGAAAAYFNAAMAQASAAGMAIAAGACAVGSLAGQIVGIATGAQDGISWKGVALAALGAGVTQGITPGLITHEAVPSDEWTEVVRRTALGSAVTQGIGVATGLQRGFSWKSVAASAAGAGVGQITGNALGSALGGLPMGNIAARTLSGLAAGTATAVMHGGRISWQQIATDAFGNMLGSSIANAMGPPPDSLHGAGQHRRIDFMPDMDRRTLASLRDKLGLPDTDLDEGWVLAANSEGAAYDLGRVPGLGLLEKATRGVRDDLVDAAVRIGSSIGGWFSLSRNLSSPNFYPDYDLGTQEGMREFLDDTFSLTRQKEGASSDQLQTAKTIMSSYFGIQEPSLAKSFKKWGSLSTAQMNGRFDAIVNRYAPYNMISEESYAEVAKDLGVNVASIKAVAAVESKGVAFLKKDMPVILFERHKFHLRTSGAYDEEYPEISNRSAGGYGRDGYAQYDRLNAAIRLDRTAALMSASWGQFQIMGENYKQAGFPGVEEFLSATKEGATRQLSIFATFIQNDARLLSALKNQDWVKFARVYNGPSYLKNSYDTKLHSAYEKYSK